MKTILILIALTSSICANAQIKKVVLQETKIGPLFSVTYNENIDINTSDTLMYVTIGYRNGKYTYIYDFGYIHLYKSGIPDRSSVPEFMKDLKLMIENLGSNMTSSKEDYKMYVSEMFPNLVFLENKDGAYTNVNRRQAEKLMQWLSGIDIETR